MRLAARSRSVLLVAAAALALGAADLALYRDALRLELTSDDYQWAQLAHAAAADWRLLAADLDTFYRPLSTVTLTLDHALWGHHPRGYHATNLALHALAATLLFAAGMRLGLTVAGAWLAAFAWLVSPFTSEPAIAVSIRFESLLLASWLGLFLAWPRAGDPWSRPRGMAVALAILLASLSKETWVVTPGLGLGLAAFQQRASARRALAVAAGLALPVLAYVALYFAAFPTGKSYYRLSVDAIGKVPHMLAVFLRLEDLAPAGFRVTLLGLVAVAATVAAAAIGLCARRPAAGMGVLLLGLPVLPTLLVPYLPIRYLAIPFAGFVLLIAAAVQPLAQAFGRRSLGGARRAGSAMAALGLLLYLAGSVAGTRGELHDHARLSRAHTRLLHQARAACGRLPEDRPVVVLRREGETPIAALAGDLRGMDKAFYVRSRDAYGLADTAALFEWVLDREDVRVISVAAAAAEAQFAGVEGVLLLHDAAGFVWPDGPDGVVGDTGATAGRLQAAGAPFRVIAVERR